MEHSVAERLQNSDDPSVRYVYYRDCCDGGLADLTDLRIRIKDSTRIHKMLDLRKPDGGLPWHAYAKWRGAFWTLLMLADLGYPEADSSLIPLKDQVMDWLLDEARLKRVPLIDGRWRRCALQESGAVYSILKLGLVEPRLERLVELLLKWQWPDGGWNCDKKPSASHSSFYESFIPLRGMNAYAMATGDPRVKTAVDRDAEMFQSRHLFRRLADGRVILDAFTQLAYPPYWHYDILTALTAMHEIGRLDDSRCAEALDLLESKRLPDGGFAADVKYYRVTQRETTGVSPVDWGPVGNTKMNEFVTVRALGVLHHAGRISAEPFQLGFVLDERSALG